VRFRRAELPPPILAPRPALVKWHDAHPDAAGWLELADVDPTPRVIQSVCWVLPYDTKPDHLSVAMDCDPASERWGNVHHIPWSWVVRIDFYG